MSIFLYSDPYLLLEVQWLAPLLYHVLLELVRTLGGAYSQVQSTHPNRQRLPTRRAGIGREIRWAVGRVLVFSTSAVYNCNILYKILGIWSGTDEAATAEERNGNENSDLHDRGSSEEGGDEGIPACYLKAGERPLCLFLCWTSIPQGARAVSRWGTNQWRLFN